MSPTSGRFGRTPFFLLLVTAVAAACAPRAGPEPLPPASAATLEVENQAFLDVNVYVLRSGTRRRLGTVTGMTTRTFVLPRTLVGSGISVRFVAEFIGSNRAPVSEEITIWEGDDVGIRIPPG